MSNRAALYLRSSKDRSDISIDAQRRALHELATSKGLVVAQEFADAVESGKDEDRPGFQQMIRALRQPERAWENVLVLDTSRIARRRHIALIFEHECDKAGIVIHYRNVPDSDPITGMLLKSILQAMDEWHSLTSKAKGLAGMAENVRQGWRAGGRAPRGYRLEYQGTGAIRDGAPVLKSRLVPNEDAPQVAQYLQGRAAGEARGRLVERLGITWPVDSLNSLEWQALTYAGHTVWNVHNERTADGYRSGEKRRPRSEWVINRNTHQAIVSDDDAEAVLAQIEKQRHRRAKDTSRPYLLTGMLVSPDEQAWHGEWDSRMDAALYRLGKGKKISARRVDGVVLDRLVTDLQADEVVAQILAAMRKEIDDPVDGRKISGLERQLEGMTRKIGRLIDLLADAEDSTMDAYRRAVAQAETERGALIEKLSEMRTRAQQHESVQAFTADDVRRLLRLLADQLQESLESGDVKTIKAALSGLVDRVVLDPVAENCTIHYRIAAPTTGDNVASPRDTQISPVKWTSKNVAILKKWAA